MNDRPWQLERLAERLTETGRDEDVIAGKDPDYYCILDGDGRIVLAIFLDQQGGIDEFLAEFLADAITDPSFWDDHEVEAAHRMGDIMPEHLERINFSVSAPYSSLVDLAGIADTKEHALAISEWFEMLGDELIMSSFCAECADDAQDDISSSKGGIVESSGGHDTKEPTMTAKNTFDRLETLRLFLEDHDDLMGIAIKAAKDMDANPFDLHKGGTFHGICLAIATAAGVESAPFVEEIVCEFADVAY